jgi:hypothetical protein
MRLFPIEDRHFDTTEVIDAESQAAMNTRTEDDFQNAFKNNRSAGNGTRVWKGTALKAMVASRPKVSFLYQMRTPVL